MGGDETSGERPTAADRDRARRFISQPDDYVVEVPDADEDDGEQDQADRDQADGSSRS